MKNSSLSKPLSIAELEKIKKASGFYALRHIFSMVSLAILCFVFFISFFCFIKLGWYFLFPIVFLFLLIIALPCLFWIGYTSVVENEVYLNNKIKRQNNLILFYQKRGDAEYEIQCAKKWSLVYQGLLDGFKEKNALEEIELGIGS